MNRFLTKIVTWLRAGYPDGVPQHDYIPLFALLSRRLTSEEIWMVAREVSDRFELDNIDIGAAILKITDEMPNPDDIERVRERLAAQGWPLDDPRDDNENEAGT